MYIYQIISILILLSSWKCDGGKPHVPSKDIFASSTKSHEKPSDYRSDAKLKLLNSLLESKSMGDKTLQKAKKMKFHTELEMK